jgi:hypothetical protein
MAFKFRLKPNGSYKTQEGITIINTGKHTAYLVITDNQLAAECSDKPMEDTDNETESK